jgi:aspartyl/asparaginyl beta-hydroxylase (cupin superfamily)
VLDKCFPFADKDSHKKTSSKAFVMAHAYSNVVIDKIEEAVKSGLVGNEDEEW